MLSIESLDRERLRGKGWGGGGGFGMEVSLEVGLDYFDVFFSFKVLEKVGFWFLSRMFVGEEVSIRFLFFLEMRSFFRSGYIFVGIFSFIVCDFGMFDFWRNTGIRIFGVELL